MSKNALEALICPQCGGEVELDENQEYGFCKYCGTKVQNTNFKIIKGEVKVVGNPTVENYMKLADRYFYNFEYDEALDYYNKSLEIDPDNWKAVFRRGVCLSQLNDGNLLEKKYIKSSAESAIKIVEKDKKQQKKLNEIEVAIAYDIGDATNNLMSKTINKLNGIFDTNLLKQKSMDYCIELADYALSLLKKVDDRTKDEEEMDSEIDTKERDKTLILLYSIIINSSYNVFRNQSLDQYGRYRKLYSEYSKIIKEIEPHYKLPLEAYKVIKIINFAFLPKRIQIDDSKEYLLVKTNNINYPDYVYNIYNNNFSAINNPATLWVSDGIHKVIVDRSKRYTIDMTNCDMTTISLYGKFSYLLPQIYDQKEVMGKQLVYPETI